MKVRTLVLILGLLVTALAGCKQASESPSTASSTPADAAPGASEAQTSGCEQGGSVEISATDTGFDKECLAAPANKAFTVAFENKDEFGHSFAVYDKEGGEQLFRGEIFSGPKTVDNDIPALEAGTYHFQCDVHPFPMQGILQVG